MIDWTRVVVLSGPSGVGKDTVLNAWIEADPRIMKVRTCTTRDPRAGEIAGVHYTFLTHEQFHELHAAGAFLEAMPVHDHWYATPYSQLEEIQEKGGIAVLSIDVQGAADVRERYPEVISIFILPPSFAELERRLRSRGTEDEARILRRLEVARQELSRANEYTHQVVNEQVEETVLLLRGLMP